MASPSQASLLLQKQLRDLCKHPVDGFSAGNSTTIGSANGTKRRSEGNKKSGDTVHTVLSANNSVSTSGNNVLDKLYGDNSETNGTSLTAAYEALPSFRVVPSSEKQNLFIRKLKMCCVVFDFSDPTNNLKEKEVKRQTLLELVEYVTSANVKFTEILMQEVMEMVSTNLFRVQSPPPRENTILEALDVEEEEPAMDPAWPHLQIVHEFLLRFIASLRKWLPIVEEEKKEKEWKKKKKKFMEEEDGFTP